MNKNMKTESYRRRGSNLRKEKRERRARVETKMKQEDGNIHHGKDLGGESRANKEQR